MDTNLNTSVRRGLTRAFDRYIKAAQALERKDLPFHENGSFPDATEYASRFDSGLRGTIGMALVRLALWLAAVKLPLDRDQERMAKLSHRLEQDIRGGLDEAARDYGVMGAGLALAGALGAIYLVFRLAAFALG